jgi:hypothetical protein
MDTREMPSRVLRACPETVPSVFLRFSRMRLFMIKLRIWLTIRVEKGNQICRVCQSEYRRWVLEDGSQIRAVVDCEFRITELRASIFWHWQLPPALRLLLAAGNRRKRSAVVSH